VTGHALIWVRGLPPLYGIDRVVVTASTTSGGRRNETRRPSASRLLSRAFFLRSWFPSETQDVSEGFKVGVSLVDEGMEKYVGYVCRIPAEDERAE
jgi:hypothetical protein